MRIDLAREINRNVREVVAYNVIGLGLANDICMAMNDRRGDNNDFYYIIYRYDEIIDMMAETG